MGAPSEAEIDVFDYLDYRAFLRDFYAQEKAKNRGFSFRAFSRRAGLSAPNHLKRVMEGDRNLAPKTAAKFAAACRLKGDAARYFEALVQLDGAKTTAERATAHQTLTGFRGYREAQRLDMAHAAYHAHWYIPAIRELAGRADFRADPEWIAERLWPNISPSEARRALHTLFELGLLVATDDGGATQADPLLTTGPELPAVHIANYHLMMLERAGASIDLVPSAERDISSVTLLLAEDGVRRIKARIQSFRQELMQMALAEERGTQVVQVGFQLFPLSVPPKREP
ncbi:MAG: TIGR02147 family protein [Sandaracinus sp.]|nr:TIGR02147 family protein [Myxococcales bacterium]MCB9631355.1 TIGR02147 family protein [Sandaracinus sp.]